jgi:hypothetical protein
MLLKACLSMSVLILAVCGNAGSGNTGTAQVRSVASSPQPAGNTVAAPTFIVLPSIYDHPFKIGDAALIAEARRLLEVNSADLLVTS